MNEIGRLFMHFRTAEITSDGTILAANTQCEYSMGFQWLLRDKFIIRNGPFYEEYKGYDINDFNLGAYRDGDDKRHFSWYYPVVGCDDEEPTDRFASSEKLWFSMITNEILTDKLVSESKRKKRKVLIPVKVFDRDVINPNRNQRCIVDILAMKRGDTFIANVAVNRRGDYYLYENDAGRAPITKRLPRSRIWLHEHDSRVRSKEFREHGGLALIHVHDIRFPNYLHDVFLYARIKPLFLLSVNDDGVAAQVSREARHKFPSDDHYSVADYATVKSFTTAAKPDEHARKLGFSVVKMFSRYPTVSELGSYVMWKNNGTVTSIPVYEDENGNLSVIDGKSWFEYALSQWQSLHKTYTQESTVQILKDTPKVKTFGYPELEKFYKHRDKSAEVACEGLNRVALSTSDGENPLPKIFLTHNLLDNEDYPELGRGRLADMVFDHIVETLLLRKTEPEVYQYLYTQIANLIERRVIRFTKRKFGGDEFFIRPSRNVSLEKVVPSISTAYLLAGIFNLYNEKVYRFEDREVNWIDASYQFFTSQFCNSNPSPMYMSLYGDESIGFGMMDTDLYLSEHDPDPFQK